MKTISRRKLRIALGAALLFFAACSRAPQPIDRQAYAKEIDEWRAKRLASLTSESGWLSLIGLFWLKEGKNTFGSDANNDIVVPKVPARAGEFVLANGVVTFQTPHAKTFVVNGAPVSSVELKNDLEENPTIVRTGSLTLQIIKREDRFGVRIKDRDNPDRANFRGLEYFPTDPKWRIEARFEPYNPPRTVPILNVLNMETDEPSPGAVVFEVNGKTYRLDAITEKGNPQFFMNFRGRHARPGNLWRGPVSLHRSTGYEQSHRYRFQQGLQSALRVHQLRHMPAAAPAKYSAREN